MRLDASRRGRWLQVLGAIMLLAATSAALAGHPTKAHATGLAATVTPSTGLHDGDTVTVQGSGFIANTEVQMEECEGTAANPPADNTKCDALSLDSQTTADSSGAFINAPGNANGTTGYVVYTLGVPGSIFHQSIQRCDATNLCTLFVGQNQNDFSKPHVFVDLAFAAVTGTTTTSTSTTTTTSTIPSSTTSTSSTTTSSVPTTTSSSSTTSSTVASCTSASTTSTTAVSASTSSSSSSTSSSTSTSSSSTSTSTSSTVPGATTTTCVPITDPPAGAGGGGAASGSGAGLPFTGSPAGIPFLAVGGLMAIGAGSAVRRRAMRAGRAGAGQAR